MKSQIRRADGRSGPLDGILDPLDRSLARGIISGWGVCAKILQEEVVARCPVKSGPGSREAGRLRAAFASGDAIGETPSHRWRYGLLTTELQRAGYYWQFVEYGNKAYVRGEWRMTGTTVKGKPQRRKVKRSVPARRARPFLRPGIIAGYIRFSETMADSMNDAIRDAAALKQATSSAGRLMLADLDRQRAGR